MEFSTLEWVDWFNHRRRPEPISYISPVEIKSSRCTIRSQAALAMVAGVQNSLRNTHPGQFMYPQFRFPGKEEQWC